MKPILPGAALGVLGSGQLGRMFALAARRMGYRVHVFSPEADSPTGQVADLEVVAPYDDLDAVRRFAGGVSAVTFEFENVLDTTAAACEEVTLVRPAGRVLHTTQNRLREKSFLRDRGIPVTPFAEAPHFAAAQYPAVLKTAAFGYDGKGQRKVASAAEAQAAWESFHRQPCILETFIEYAREVSVVGARGVDGTFAHYGVIENEHANHILDVSRAPVPGADEAIEIARAVFEALDVVGVLCVEMFQDHAGRLMVNELAPRPHNSGHLTIEACATSQFEQQVRALCGLPLGSTEYRAPAAMANLLGDHYPLDIERILSCPGVVLHLYGKAEARKGRKMGHLTALAPTTAEAARLVRSARG